MILMGMSVRMDAKKNFSKRFETEFWGTGVVSHKNYLHRKREHSRGLGVQSDLGLFGRSQAG